MYKSNSITLTPIYDTVCTLAYPNLTNKLSMKIGKHSEIKKVNKDDLSILAEQLGLKPKTVNNIYFELFDKVCKAFEIIKKDLSLSNQSKIIEILEQNITKRKLN
jgi:serine/threonine-protein kinase HipA